jgi:hypothetical protein
MKTLSGNQKALALNLARHAEESHILAGNEVCAELMKQCGRTIRELLGTRIELDDLVKDASDHRLSDDLIGKRFRMLLSDPTCTCGVPVETPHAEDCPITSHVRALFAQSGEYPS